jgi:ATP-binding cassette subfamily F protein 3
VVTIDHLTHVYNDDPLFLDANLLIERGDRIAILGEIGSGKSTLLRMMMGMEKTEDGMVSLGQHNVIPGYFEQNQAEALDLNRTVLDTIHDEVPDWKNEEVRTLLGRFLFSGETVFKPVSALSGGEKARLALAKMLLRPANLLLLDEPTNHLDIPAKEMLEEALQKYDGTVVIVSHDRYFISRVANKIVEIRDGELHLYRGDYHYYLDKLEEEKQQKIQEEKTKAKAAKKKNKSKSGKGKKKVAK